MLKLPENKQHVLFICAGLFCFLTAFVLLQSFKGKFGEDTSPTAELPVLEETIDVSQSVRPNGNTALQAFPAAQADKSRKWVVYISGSVKNPGVYEIQPDSRVYQALDAAGGFAAGADRNCVNLAAPLRDGAHIIFPAQGESNGRTQPGSSLPPVLRQTQTDGGHSVSLINLNTCTVSELQTLPGIGPKTAQLILAYRDENGGFGRIEDLLLVKGIGPKKYDAIREFITAGS